MAALMYRGTVPEEWKNMPATTKLATLRKFPPDSSLKKGLRAVELSIRTAMLGTHNEQMDRVKEFNDAIVAKYKFAID